MQERTHEKIGLVFIHGAGLEGNIWSQVAEGLGHPCLLVDYPMRRSPVDARSGLSLEDYAAHMIRQVEQWGIRRFVIVAHSLGGVLALKLAADLTDRLAGFVAVGAAIPKGGGSFLSALPFPKRLLMSAVMRRWGTKPPDSAIRAGLCNDLTEEQTAEIVKGFTPEAVRVYTDRVDAPVPAVPKLYVTLTKDKGLGPSLQRTMVANLSPQSVRTLETGHLPMLSDPAGLRTILHDFLRGLAAH
jgi:pimeloyl-ACP methyl ester carboxylesterase